MWVAKLGARAHGFLNSVSPFLRARVRKRTPVLFEHFPGLIEHFPGLSNIFRVLSTGKAVYSNALTKAFEYG